MKDRAELTRDIGLHGIKGKYAVVIEDIHPRVWTFENFSAAVKDYRIQREYYGDNVRLMQIIADYGQEI